MTKKIKILQIVPSLSQANGVAAYISNYFINMKKDNIEMTFLVLNNRDHGRYNEIEENGGKIVELFVKKNIFKYIKKVDEFFKCNKFDIVHCHVPNYGAIMLFFAKKYNVKIRILHSHVNKSADRLLHKLRNDIISPIAVKYANKYFACSEDAGKFLFKKRQFKVINNAIPIEKYIFSEKIRDEYRKELKIQDKFVIGEFGRLCPQKNQLFTIDIFNEVLKLKENAVLLLVGNGNLEEKIIKKIKKLGIENKVIMLGSRNDTGKLYNCLDSFLLPSIYEGLGIVLIEAQVNGLACFTSEKLVPQTANVSSLMHYIQLNNNPQEWASILLEHSKGRKDVKNQIINAGFSIENESEKLYEEYVNMVK